MALKATIVETKQDIVLDDDDTATLQLLERYRGGCGLRDGIGVIECREHDDVKRLAHRRDPDDNRVHGAWLYVTTKPFSQGGGSYLILAHHPLNDPELKSDRCQVRVGMSDQHRAEQDYLVRAGDAVGFSMRTEEQLPGARIDVYGETSETKFGFEVQVSGLAAAVAKRRDHAAIAAGVPVVWTADRSDLPWTRRNAVANVVTMDAIAQLGARLGTWRVARGVRNFELRPCVVRWFPHGCPDRRRGWCGSGWHPVWEALVEGARRFTIDELLQDIGTGRLRRLDTGGKQGVVIVPRAKYRQWIDQYGPDELERVRGIPAQRGEHDHAGRRPCTYDRVDELPVPRPRDPTVTDEPAVRGPRDMRETCTRCGTLTGIADGLCLECRMSTLP